MAGGGSPPKTHVVVLLVEDDVVDQKLIRRRFREKESFTLVQVASLQEAELAISTNAKIDCILLDWHLPDALGPEALARLTPADIPIVILTGDSDSLAEEALAFGAQDYLSKHEVSTTALFRSIRYAIARNTASRLGRRLQHAQRLGAVGQMVAGITHEINNPSLWIALNQQQMLRSLASQPKTENTALMQRLIAENQSGILRIQGVVKRLRGFSGRWQSQVAPGIFLGPLLREAAQTVNPETRHRGTVSVDCGDDLPPITADRGALLHLLINLLINACHAIDTAPAGKHHIRLYARSGLQPAQIRIGVDDTVPGIPTGLREKVVEPFFTTRGADKGTGLGLSIVSEIAQQHNGTLFIGDAPIGGARVEVLLPVQPPQQQRTPTPAPEPILPQEAPERALRVLLIDDEEHILDTLQRILQPHLVTTTNNGLEALALLEEGVFDVVLCDLAMPDCTGADIYRALSTTAPALRRRFVVMTGGAVTPQLQAFLHQETVRVIRKPFRIAQLEALLQQVVEEDLLRAM